MTSSRQRLQLVALPCVIAIAIIVSMASDAQARGSRGPSPQQIKAAQEKLQQQQQMQAAYAAAQQKVDTETVARFDLNKNGKIDSSEKAPWDKYWRDVNSGKEPHPYASIKITPASSTTSKTGAKPAAKKPTTK